MKKVLLINDDPDFQRLIKKYLSRKGFLAETIDMADDVIPFVEEFKPDVIIVDMKMETDKGICSQLRQELKIEAKLVLLSDQSVKPTTLHICKPDVVLQKPFHPEELVEKIAM
jgi:two-component system, OmpR family, response regulator BaeR